MMKSNGLKCDIVPPMARAKRSVPVFLSSFFFLDYFLGREEDEVSLSKPIPWNEIYNIIIVVLTTKIFIVMCKSPVCPPPAQ